MGGMHTIAPDLTLKQQLKDVFSKVGEGHDWSKSINVMDICSTQYI